MLFHVQVLLAAFSPGPQIPYVLVRRETGTLPVCNDNPTGPAARESFDAMAAALLKEATGLTASEWLPCKQAKVMASLRDAWLMIPFAVVVDRTTTPAKAGYAWVPFTECDDVETVTAVAQQI